MAEEFDSPQLPQDTQDAIAEEDSDREMRLLGLECTNPYLGQCVEYGLSWMHTFLFVRDGDFGIGNQEALDEELELHEDFSDLSSRAEFLIRLDEHLMECERCRIIERSENVKDGLLSDGWERWSRNLKRKDP